MNNKSAVLFFIQGALDTIAADTPNFEANEHGYMNYKGIAIVDEIEPRLDGMADETDDSIRVLLWQCAGIIEEASRHAICPVYVERRPESLTIAKLQGLIQAALRAI